MKRLVTVFVVFALVAAAGGFVAWRIHGRGPDEPSVNDALGRFRSSSTTAGEAPHALQPHAGVYVYRGTGSERLSFLDTSQSQGPEEPGTLTPGANGCWTFEIEYNSYHHQTWQRCARDGRLVELGGTTNQQFDFVAFKQSEHSEMRCDPPMTLVDTDAAPGTTWPVHCTGHSQTTNSDLTQTGTVTLIGVEDVTVGGTAVPAYHSRLDVVLSGDQTGETHSDMWFATSDGLPLRDQHDIRVVSPAPAPLNEVTYREQGSFDLTSLSART
jgi:hypothetical protein